MFNKIRKWLKGSIIEPILGAVVFWFLKKKVKKQLTEFAKPKEEKKTETAKEK